MICDYNEAFAGFLTDVAIGCCLKDFALRHDMVQASEDKA